MRELNNIKIIAVDHGYGNISHIFYNKGLRQLTTTLCSRNKIIKCHPLFICRNLTSTHLSDKKCNIWLYKKICHKPLYQFVTYFLY